MSRAGWILGWVLAGACWELRGDSADLVARFEAIRTHTVWPVEGSGLDDIEETFGPRRQPSNEGAYDWHRGIDIDGANGRWVVAVHDGEFVKYTYSTSGGHTVVLKHAFSPPVDFGGRTLTSFYTWYLHLEDAQVPAWVKDAEANGLRPAVTAGQVIGYMGNSGQGPGGAYAVHLHFELRVGTQSSLEFQLANFATNSASFYGFDPHVHPLLLYPPSPSQVSITRMEMLSGTNDARYRLRVDNDDSPNLNRVEVRVIDRSSGWVARSHVLDLNERTGFDASSTAALDSRDLLKPHFAPLYFVDAQTDYQTELVVPRAYLDGLGIEQHGLRVLVKDIWGRTAEHPAPPRLQVEAGAGAVDLSWPVDHWGYRAEHSPGLGGAANWGAIAGLPEVVSGAFKLRVTTPDAMGFWRLIRPVVSQ